MPALSNRLYGWSDLEAKSAQPPWYADLLQLTEDQQPAWAAAILLMIHKKRAGNLDSGATPKRRRRRSSRLDPEVYLLDPTELLAAGEEEG